MPAIIPSLSVPLSGVRLQPAQAAASVTPGTQAASQTPVIPKGIPQAIPPDIAPAAMRMETPVWPLSGAVNLLPALIGLSETQITRTDTLTLPETGADFWDMLATALPGEG